MTLTREIDALNTMLDAIGAAPVNTLDDLSIDVAKARSLLAQVNREVQSRGWHFNSDTKYALARTAEGEYLLPENALRIDASADFPWRNVVARGGKLWDRDNRTFTFTEELTFDIVWLFPFEELPEAARNYIMIRAARRFQERAVGSGQLARFNERDEAQALQILAEAEADTEDNNVLSGNWSVGRVLSRDSNDEW